MTGSPPHKLERARLDAAADPRALLPFLTVSALVGYSKSKIYALIQGGKFPQPVKIGKAARWRAAEVQQWLREQGGSEGGPEVPLRVLDPAAGHVEGLTRAVVRLAGQVKAQGRQIDALLRALSPNGDMPISIPEGEALEVAETKTKMRGVDTILATAPRVDGAAQRLDDVPADVDEAAIPWGEARELVMKHLAAQMGIPSSTMVPFGYQIEALARILRRQPEPSDAQWRAMDRWFWRTSVTSYGGWFAGMKAAASAAAIAFASGQEYELDAPTTSPGTSLWFTRPFRFNSALAKTLALILMRAPPKDLLTGKDIDTASALSWWGAREFNHLFPLAFLKSRGVSSSKAQALANVICLSPESNELIMDQRPSQYLARVLDERGDAARKWLATNLIEDEAVDAALIDDYDGFLVARAATIDEHVRRLTGWSS